jgi:hypothetical protein
MPLVTHKERTDEDRKLPVLLHTCAKMIDSSLRKDADQYRGWMDEENLLVFRKRLLDALQRACLDRDDLQGREARGNPGGPDPYLEITVLSMICSYHTNPNVNRVFPQIAV